MKLGWQATAGVLVLGARRRGIRLVARGTRRRDRRRRRCRQLCPAHHGATRRRAAASAPSVRYPIETAPARGPHRRPSRPDVQALLTDLFGRKRPCSRCSQLDGFCAGLVATVDNPGTRARAAEPVARQSGAGASSSSRPPPASSSSPDNGLLHPCVLLIETVDLRKVDAVYRQLYPQAAAAPTRRSGSRTATSTTGSSRVIDNCSRPPSPGAARPGPLPRSRGRCSPSGRGCLRVRRPVAAAPVGRTAAAAARRPGQRAPAQAQTRTAAPGVCQRAAAWQLTDARLSAACRRTRLAARHRDPHGSSASWATGDLAAQDQPVRRRRLRAGQHATRAAAAGRR